MTEIKDVDKKKNVLVERLNKVPGQTFRIPSRGILYTHGELDEEVKDGEVVVYPMTTLDEIYMRSPDMIYQGTAIEKVLRRCVPQIKEPLNLFAGDVDYLLTALRQVSYGNTLPINHKCVFCGDTTEQVHEYLLPLSYFLKNSKEFTNDLSKLKITLDFGFTVNIRPARMSEMLVLYQQNEDKIESPEQLQELLALSLASTIESVSVIEGEEITDRAQIMEWIKEMPRNAIEEFSSKLSIVNNWGTTFKYSADCLDCGKTNEISTVLNPIYFFILPSSQKTSN